MSRRLLIFLFLCWCAPARPAEKLLSNVDRTSAQAMSILRANCLSCHNDEKKKGGLTLTTRENALKGGDDGPVLAPGKMSDRLLAKVIRPASDPHMPPNKQLSEKDVAAVRRWMT